MKPAFVALCLSLLACGSPAGPKPIEAPLDIKPLAPDAPKPTRTAPAYATFDLPSFIKTDDVQSVTPAQSAAFVNVAAIRGHRLGDRLRDIVRRDTPGMDLFDDVDWVLSVGPDVTHIERNVVLIAVRPSADVEWAIDRLLRGVTGAKARATEIEIEGIRGRRLPEDRGDRVILRVRQDLVVLVREAQAAPAVRAFRKGGPGMPPAREMVGIYGEGSGARLGGIGAAHGFDELRVAIEARDDGGAEVRLAGRCTDATTATTAAQELTDLASMANQLAGRVSSRGIFADAKATANGNTVSMTATADEQQLTSLFDALGMVP